MGPGELLDLLGDEAGPARPLGRHQIYDESADGAQQIAAALATARAEDKRVLLQSGANWCGWCRSLHKLFTTDQAIIERLKNDFVVVMIDVNAEHNKDVELKDGHPTRYGIPAIVILGARGKRLKVKDTADLENEKEGHNPARCWPSSRSGPRSGEGTAGRAGPLQAPRPRPRAGRRGRRPRRGPATPRSSPPAAGPGRAR